VRFIDGELGIIGAELGRKAGTLTKIMIPNARHNSARISTRGKLQPRGAFTGSDRLAVLGGT